MVGVVATIAKHSPITTTIPVLLSFVFLACIEISTVHRLDMFAQ
jgi:hypothetical protein